MRTFLRSKVRLLFVAFAVVLAIPAIALADVVQSDVVEATAGQKVVSVQAGQTTSDIGYRINNTGGDTTDTTGGGSTTTNQTCNPEVKAAKLTLSGLPPGVTVKDTSGNTLTAPHLTFTTCDTYQYVKLAVGSAVDAGDYTISVADITNDGYVSNDFTENAATFTLRVTAATATNHAPTVSTAAANADGTEGDTLSASGAFSDQDNNTLDLSADNTEGTFTDNGDGTWNWSLATNDDVAGGTITVTADDGHGGSVTDDFHYSAANANPAVSIDAITKPDGSTLGSVACLAGNKVSLDFSFTDAGSADTHDASIDWGDNSTDTTRDPALSPEENVEHTYTGLGPYTITVTVTDDDAGVGTDDNGLSPLSFRYNMSGILSPFNPDGTSTFKYGSTVPVKVKITDCAGTPVSGLSPKLGVRLQSPATPVLGINEDVYSTSNADTGNTLRYDASAGQYIYNYNTKSNMTPDSTASYYMIVEEASSAPNPVSQKFALKLK